MTYNSTFKDRAAQAAEARRKALEQYKARPPVDEQRAAERLAAAQQRDSARAEKAEAKKAERTAEDAAKAAEAAPPTEAERKAARDAKYAARKNRK